jgi:hypothetical protein
MLSCLLGRGMIFTSSRKVSGLSPVVSKNSYRRSEIKPNTFLPVHGPSELKACFLHLVEVGGPSYSEKNSKKIEYTH